MTNDTMDPVTGFPLEGKVCRVDYGELVVEHDYRDHGKLTFTSVQGPLGKFSGTVDITVGSIRDDVLAIAFQDAYGRAVMVEDLAARSVNTFVFDPSGLIHHYTGRLTVLGSEGEATADEAARAGKK